MMFDDLSTIKKTSIALLDALFYVPPLGFGNKYVDIHILQCLQEVSQIPIVVVENIPDLNFIVAQKLGECAVRYHDITLTKYAGCSLKENKYLVWTIVPLVELPYNSISPAHQNKLKNLGMLLSPSIDDVVLNLKNLSTSVFANSLRSRVLECNTDFVISQSKLLPTIVIAMLTYLQQELMSDSRISFKDACNQLECHDLSNLEIIPVKLSINDTVEEYSLVKPIQILYMDPSDVAPYYPFFHPLIEEAYGILNLLLQIGVQMSLDFSLNQLHFLEIHP